MIRKGSQRQNRIKKTMLELKYIEKGLESLRINKARRNSIAAFLVGILAVQTVSLPHIANVLPTQATKSSAYIRKKFCLYQTQKTLAI